MFTSFMMGFQWDHRMSILFYSITYCILILLASVADTKLKFKILSVNIKVLIVLGSQYYTWQTETNHFGSSTQWGFCSRPQVLWEVKRNQHELEESKGASCGRQLHNCSPGWPGSESTGKAVLERKRHNGCHERTLFVHQWLGLGERIFNPG